MQSTIICLKHCEKLVIHSSLDFSIHTNSNTDEPWMPKYTHHYNLCYTTLYRLCTAVFHSWGVRLVGRRSCLSGWELFLNSNNQRFSSAFFCPPPPPPHCHLWPPWIVWNIARTGQPWLDELRVEATVTTCLACSTEGWGPVCFALLLSRCLTHSSCHHLFSLFNWGWRPSVFCTVAGSVLDTQLLSPLV